MKEPIFDRHGYPTEKTLKAIERWDSAILGFPALMKFIAAGWHFPERAREKSNGLWVFSTGGWSGNESLIGALEKNRMFWMLNECLSLQGGLHIFAITNNAKKELGKMEDKIVKWAWSVPKGENNGR